MEGCLREDFGIKSLYNYQSSICEALKIEETSNVGCLNSLTARVCDLVVYCPTGFGKTLAYVMPIYHYLNERSGAVDGGVSALVLTPSRELAQQVFGVFELFFAGGSHSESVDTTPPRFSLELLDGSSSLTEERMRLQGRHHPRGPDVLVSTAARLTLHSEPIGMHGNTCDWSRLRFLVVDEADRLLSDSYRHWLFTVSTITRQADIDRGALCSPSGGGGGALHTSNLSALSANLEPDFFRAFWLPHDKPDPPTHHPHTTPPPPPPSPPQVDLDPFKVLKPVRLQKLLFTATDIRTYTGLHHLNLLEPVCIRATLHKDHLKQKISKVENPLEVLTARVLHILRRRSTQVLIFCSTVVDVSLVSRALRRARSSDGKKHTPDAHTHAENTHAGNTHAGGRELPPADDEIMGIAGGSSGSHRLKVLQAFKKRRCRVLVATDLYARGLHFDKITHVLQYGRLPSLDEYIHRVGRTARTGAKGRSELYFDDPNSRVDLDQFVRDIQRIRPTSHIRLSRYECSGDQQSSAR